MPAIDFKNVSKRYGDQLVVPNFSLSITDSSFIVILGPSGCGKSTVLRMLAGLEQVSDGQIFIDNNEVQKLSPSARGCAMVFQNYALYPHMTVSENIGYGMKIKGVSPDKRATRISEVASTLGLTDLLNRRPTQLSGGQRQRVAIGRAIAREPSVLLFDEPLSNLDAKLRGEMRIELAALHKRIHATSIYVTHDQVEAMTLADQIVVMNQGQIVQVGSPAEIYKRPNCIFVAQFVGTPPMNLFLSSVHGGVVCFQSDTKIELGHLDVSDRTVQIGVRPEAIRLSNVGESAKIVGIEKHGREVIHYLETTYGRVTSIQPDEDTTYGVGDLVHFNFDKLNICIFENTVDGLSISGFTPSN